MDLDVLFLGTAGSAPTAQRGLPATLVRRGGDRLLFDCGEGTQRQLVRSIGLIELEEVFLTHFHADHVLGLPGMLKTFSLRQRERPLTVYGPVGLARLFKVLAAAGGQHAPSRSTLVELEPNEELDRDGYRIAAYEADHVPRALGYAIVEDPRPGHFDPERARELGVTPGPDFGRLQQGETVNGVRPDQVMGETRRGRKVVLAGDGAAERDDPPRGLRRRPARARGHLPGGGGGPGGRDQALHGPRRRGAGGRGRRAHARAHARVHPLRRRRRCATRPARRSSA